VGGEFLPCTRHAASLSQADVQTAVNASSPGDVVCLPAGSATWTGGGYTTGGIELDGITIQGAGINSTVITDHAGGYLFGMINNGATPCRVSHLTIDADNTAKSGLGCSIQFAGQDNTQQAFRIHHVKLLNLNARGIVVFMNGEDTGGVIDHCTFTATTDGSAQGCSIFGASSEESDQFAYTINLGSSHFVFLENNTFTYDFINDGTIDAYGGARYVFRYNTVTGTDIEHHGADSGSYRGVHSFEIYQNTFTNNGPVSSRAFFFRSGTGVVYNNTWNGSTAWAGMDVSNYRSSGSYVPWGQCNGSSIWDENTPGQGGYACLDQIGHVFTAVSGGANALEPLYQWNNVVDGNSSPTISVVDGGADIVVNRDYYNNTSRPGYTAYTYPHPMVV